LLPPPDQLFFTDECRVAAKLPEFTAERISTKYFAAASIPKVFRDLRDLFFSIFTALF
jgi:hypothetical protein